MGFFDKIFAGLSKTRENLEELESLFQTFAEDQDEFFDELEELLIISDVGASTAVRVCSKMRLEVMDRRIRKASDAKACLINILTAILEKNSSEMKLETKPSVILVVGVNGVGKTTTIGKLATKYVEDGKKVLLGAADTFRAAAAEQLTIWAERSGADIVRHEEGSDPAAVVFDSISAAKARDKDIIIIDTAGRLHNKQNLMNELNKIRRIISRELPECDIETLLVIDATTGQNGLIQAKQFLDTCDLTGIVLTKLDGTAKGGIVFPISTELGIPVKFVGVGEKKDDLIPFNAKEFTEALFK